MSKRSERGGIRFTHGWERGREGRNVAIGQSIVPDPASKRERIVPQRPSPPEPSLVTTPPQINAISEAQVGQDIALVRSQLRRGVLELSKSPDGKLVFKQNGRPIDLVGGSITPHDGAEPVYYRAEFAEALRREVVQIQGSRIAAETTLREIAQDDPELIRDLKSGVFASPSTKDAAVARARAEMEQKRRDESRAAERNERSLSLEMQTQLQHIELGQGFRPQSGLEATQVVVTDTMRKAFTILATQGEFRISEVNGDLVIARKDHVSGGPYKETEIVYADVDPITGYSKPTIHNQFGVALHPHAVAVIRERVQKHKAQREKLGISTNRHEDPAWQAQFDRSIQVLLRTGIAEEAYRLAQERGLDFTFESDPVELGIGVWPSIRVKRDDVKSRWFAEGSNKVTREIGRRAVAVICAEVPPDVKDTVSIEVYERPYEVAEGKLNNGERRLVSSTDINEFNNKKFVMDTLREDLRKLG